MNEEDEEVDTPSDDGEEYEEDNEQKTMLENSENRNSKSPLGVINRTTYGGSAFTTTPQKVRGNGYEDGVDIENDSDL